MMSAAFIVSGIQSDNKAALELYEGFVCKGGKTKCVKIGNGGNGVSGCVIEG